MTYQELTRLSETILKSSDLPAPYNKPAYLDYVKLNLSRMNRWMKTMQLAEGLVQLLKTVDK